MLHFCIVIIVWQVVQQLEDDNKTQVHTLCLKPQTPNP